MVQHSEVEHTCYCVPNIKPEEHPCCQLQHEPHLPRPTISGPPRGHGNNKITVSKRTLQRSNVHDIPVCLYFEHYITK